MKLIQAYFKKFKDIILLCFLMIASFIPQGFAKVDYSQTPVKELVEILKTGPDVDKWHVVHELGRRGESAIEVVPVLIQALKSEDKGFQYRAALALKSIDTVNSHNILVEFVDLSIDRLKDQSWRERKMAADFLGEFGVEKAIPNLNGLLKDPHDRVKLSAGLAIIKILSTQSPIEGMDETSVKKEVWTSLSELLGSNDQWIRAESALHLIEGQPDKDIERAQDVLRRSLISSDRDFRVGLLFSMLASKGVKSVEKTSDILEEIEKSGDAAEQHLARSLLKLLK